MSGIHHALFAAASNVAVTFPPGSASDWTTVYGVHTIFAGPAPPTIGSLQVDNTSGSDSAYSYLNALPSSIADSTQIGDFGAGIVASPQLQGLFARGVLQATPTVLQDGYRCDYLFPVLRIIKFSSGSASVLASATLTGYYALLGNAASIHFVVLGTALSTWLSASGQADSTVVSTTDSSFSTGRVGLVSFYNVLGSGGPNFWSGYGANWTV